MLEDARQLGVEERRGLGDGILVVEVALRPFARFSQLNASDQLLEFELVDGEKWTNDAYLPDIGFNWYPNRFVKFYVDWQHSFFGSPVEVNEATGLRRPDADLFWIRCQVRF